MYSYVELLISLHFPWQQPESMWAYNYITSMWLAALISVILVLWCSLG